MLIKNISYRDINRRVIYTDSTDPWISIHEPEHGRITKIDEVFIYVQFDGRSDSIPVDAGSLTFEQN